LLFEEFLLLFILKFLFIIRNIPLFNGL
jgi:hypothetical protein